MDNKKKSSDVSESGFNESKLEIGVVEDVDASLPNSWGIRQCLAWLVSQRHCQLFAESVQRYLPKQIWTPNDRQQLLAQFAEHLLHPQCTIAIATSFQPIILEILERVALKVHCDGVFKLEEHERLCVALGRIIDFIPDASKFLKRYCQSSPPLFERLLVQPAPQAPKKKKKKRKSQHDGEHERILQDIAITGYRLLQHSRQTFTDMWDWSPFLQLLDSKDKTLKWYVAQVVSMVTNMADDQTQELLANHFSTDEIQQFTIKNMQMFQHDREQVASLLTNHRALSMSCDNQGTHTKDTLTTNDLGDSVVSVCGVLLPLQDASQKKSHHRNLVPVSSSQRNLHSLAIAVASGNPVLLEGPVGSGKTTLVEHLAQVTGRNGTPHLLKVQLGDQTDSKALIGSYRCTDIPGEFVWQPGALTQAVTGGHWILLEDIDYAPMDVVSVLMPLLESRTLSIPGHGDEVKAAPGFQLFATQRLLASSMGYFKQHSSHATLLDQLWTKVTVEPLSRKELQQVIVTLFPKLSTVADKLLEIFCMLSAGRHDNDEGSTEEASGSGDASVTSSETNRMVSPHEGRLVSTRDLLKWCERIVADFDVASSQTGNMVFMEALDCFCASLPKPSTRVTMAEIIGSRLNLTKENTRFLCSKYKPTIEISSNDVNIVRARLQRRPESVVQLQRRQSSFAYTRPALVLLERVAACIARNEAVLLVGETGTGKTSTVQYLAELTGQRLKVINMNQQSDSTDLLGGFKPVDIRQLIAPVREEFECLFIQTFSQKQNAKFLAHIQECFAKKRWNDLIQLMVHCHKNACKRFEKKGERGDQEDTEESSGKTSPTQRSQWRDLGLRLQQLKTQIHHAENALAFSFIEGTLVKALKAGDWVLLDEINLATAETLECLSGLLESTEGSVILMERGDSQPIVRHKDFRLFACMNPATDVGKKELPPGIRNRFTEFFVDELEDIPDLKVLVINYLEGLGLSSAQVDGIVQFYLSVRQLAIQKLTDGTGHRPHYSLRTLCRALRNAASNMCGNVLRSLYESFCLSFLTQLDRASHPMVEQLVCKHVIGRSNIKGIVKQPIPPPASGNYVKMEGYWIAAGNKEALKPRDYIITPSVKANLHDLARIVSAGRFPVLIQGETSVGKTSLIQYLAQATGNQCVRVNNHEHTDLQEYVGFYAADETGKLVFKEGVLVDAMRKGHWIILDELNLAPTDVLEALNRLLDDNRELFIPETQETVGAHPRFMLFATQNPPGQYGGRKVLSRAFRNRFVELHFDEIPSRELETILHQRCAVPMSYCQKMVAVMLDLQTRRKGSGVFAGKQGFMTLRDLFRWAERYRQSSHGEEGFYDWDQHIANDGYMLIAGRVRRPDEGVVIQEVLEKHIKRKVDPTQLFAPSQAILQRLVVNDPPQGFGHVVWTYSTRRLAVLVGQALRFKEPILLVGETGCGKTTICQLFAASSDQSLHTVNCHLHTETSDFLGGLRPVRHHDTEDEEERLKLFEWCDGPLVQAMKDGAAFLIDEISLADDSVLERLNSVLEPERALLLAERGSGEKAGEDIPQIVAKEEFCVFATMNPGGDFGKKELSPALRNRFTEIWCPPSNDRQDLISIIEHNLVEGIQLGNQEDGSSGVGKAIMDFVEWFVNNEAGKRCTVSIRDILSWVNFINTCCNTPSQMSSLDPAVAYIHGACLVFLDGLGSGTTSSSSVTPTEARKLCLKYLHDQIWQLADQDIDLTSLTVTSDLDRSKRSSSIIATDGLFGIHPFYIPQGPLQLDSTKDQYALDAPTTALNAQRVLRGLQLPRAILLEGSPGVGKTSLVSAIAKASGHELVRINLSEQTDVTDLFGADLPVEGGEGGQFAWRDGPLLRALRAGHWVVLDELNLASQSVLEGLNACLDHRAEIYVPELGRSFHIEREKTRLFACQNPLKQGGGRKGLPRSFLNRFTQVYVEPLTSGDLLFIAHTMYPMIGKDLLAKMVEFNNKLYHVTMVESQWGQRGGPWEFNLRDLFRWCDLMVHDQWNGGKVKGQLWNPGQHVGLIYRERLRLAQDKDKLLDLFHSCFQGEDVYKAYQPSRHFHITPSLLQVGHSFLPRHGHYHGNQETNQSSLQLLHHSLAPLESLIKCIEMNWMAILVGPKSCGKTSLVHLLAQLTGHKLRVLAMNSAMDTTELLGGFEQADINRHWEEVVLAAKTTIAQTIRSLLLNKEKKISHHAQGLMASWASLWKMSQYRQGNQGSAEATEYRLTSGHVAMLDQVVSKVTSLQQECGSDLIEAKELNAVRSAVNDLKVKFEKEGDSNVPGGGGKFEWVDGLLVQALQQGDWLLIDNVNFCSPSVLDRLNALLEPNGKLSINERGVLDGEIPIITPHPDFRLILAMDPRHGEISRAMRNRGVEIYILGMNEGAEYDVQDVKMMLHSLGLVGKIPSDVLMNIHEEIKQQMRGTEISGLPAILHAASLTVQLMQHGRSLQTALYEACMDVFVRSQLSQINRQKAKEIIVTVLQSEELTRVDSDAACLQEPALPAVKEFSCNSSWAMVQRSGVVLMHAINQMIQQPTTSAILQSEEQLNTDSIDVATILQPASLLYMEQATPSGWPAYSQWLTETWNDKVADGKVHGGSTEGITGFALCMPGVMSETLEKVFKHLLCEKLMGVLKTSFTESASDYLTHYPLDIHWDMQVLKHMESCAQMRASQMEVDDEDEDSTEDDVTAALAIATRLHLLLRRSFQCHIEEHSRRKPGKANVIESVLDLSEAFHKGHCTLESLPHPVVAHIKPFFQAWDEFVQTSIGHDDHMLTEDNMQQVLLALEWRDRFYHLCCYPILLHRGKTAIMLHWSAMALHWTWLMEYTINVIPGLLLGRDACMPQNLQVIIDQIQQHLCSSVVKIPQQRTLLHQMGAPMPFKTEVAAEVALHVNALCKSLAVTSETSAVLGVSASDKLCKEVELAVMDRGDTCKKLMELVSVTEQMNVDAVESADEDTMESIDALAILLCRHGLFRADQATVDVPMETNENKLATPDASSKVAMTVAMWPLMDYMALCAQQNVVGNLLESLLLTAARPTESSSVAKADKFLQAFLPFAIHHTPANPLHLAPLHQMCSIQDGVSTSMLYHQMSKVITAYHAYVWHSTATSHVERWLTWQPSVDCDEKGVVDLPSTRLKMAQGPAAMFSPIQAQCVFQLLLPSKSLPSNQEGTKTNRVSLEFGAVPEVPLGYYEEKLDQLVELNKLLWVNAGCSDFADFCSKGMHNLHLSLGRLLMSMLTIIPEEHQQSWKDAITTMITVATKPESDKDDGRTSKDTLKMILEEMHRKALSRTSEDKSCLPVEVIDLMVQCVQCVARQHAMVTVVKDDVAMDTNEDDGKGVQRRGKGVKESDVEKIGRVMASIERDMGDTGTSQAYRSFFHILEQGYSWAYLGILESSLLAPQGPVDPAEEYSILLKYAQEEHSGKQKELHVRNMSSDFLTGQRLCDIPEHQLHGRIKALMQRLSSLEETRDELSKQTAYRPDPPQFQPLLKDITYFMTSIGSRSSIEGLLHKLTTAFLQILQSNSNKTNAKVTAALNEEKAWQNTSAKFLSKIEEEYPLYHDLWLPFVSGVMHTCYGLRLVAHAVQCAQQRKTIDGGKLMRTHGQMKCLEDMFTSIVEFPASSKSFAGQYQVDNTSIVQELLASICHYDETMGAESVHMFTLKLQHIALLQILNHSIISGSLDYTTVSWVHQILTNFVSTWHKALVKAKQDEEEAASLYKFQSKTYGDGLTDDEREEREFLRSFPSYQQDFDDITAEPTLEGKPKVTPDPSESDNVTSDLATTHLSDEEMAEICAIHYQLYTKLVDTLWMKGQGSEMNAVNYGDVLKRLYQILVKLFSGVLPYLDPSLFSKMKAAHLLMTHSLTTTLTARNDDDQAPPSLLVSKPFDIYHDANVSEAVQCRPVLEKFRVRIGELLAQWPEHPTLKQVVLLIDRILSFPVTSPLMKFVTGLELLLEKAQVWESNASRAVSIQDHLESISRVIIQWRKLELRCWSSCMDTVAFQQEQSATKYWFHLYQLLHTYLQQEKEKLLDDNNKEAETEEETDEPAGEEVTIKSLMTAFQQFMESASLGQYGARLRMLLAFHCQMSMVENPLVAEVEVRDLLWNLHGYYNQFSEAIQNEIQTQRTPIEKDLKSFVKISRWNDINFWAMKEAVLKSHRTLHKFSKKFEVCLLASARSVFTDNKMADKEDTMATLEDDATPGEDKSWKKFLLADTMKILEQNLLPVAEESSTKSIQDRLPILVPRMRKLCQVIFSKSAYPQLTQVVDEFTGELISAVKDLQTLDVTKDAEKEKQLKEAKNIQQRKRKALADLFKYLVLIGLSYRKGLNVARQSDKEEWVHLPPLNLKVALQDAAKDHGFDVSDVGMVWEICQKYFLRSIARRAFMVSALANPSKELGLGNIDRCRGFTEHLMQMANEQRRTLATITEGFNQLQVNVQHLEQLHATAPPDSKSPKAPQDANQLLIAIKDLADQSWETVHQYLLLLECCPSGTTAEDRQLLTPTPSDLLAPLNKTMNGDASWQKLVDKLKTCQDSIKHVKATLDQHIKGLRTAINARQISLWSDVALMEDAVNSLGVVEETCMALVSAFTVSETGHVAETASAARELIDRVRQSRDSYRDWHAGLNNTDSNSQLSTSTLQSFQATSDEMVACILCAVQELVKGHQGSNAEEKSDNQMQEEDQIEEELGLQTGHLVKQLDGRLSHDRVTLDLVKVTASIKDMFKQLQKLRSLCCSEDDIKIFNQCVTLLLRTTPIVHQYTGLVAYYLQQSVVSHNATCKLLSVLLGVFTELATKGFCLPEGFAEELSGEGATEFEDIEGGGIGDGEGSKDVSDQIENEDQVEDTQKPGDEKEEKPDNQPDIQDEEHGIEMSDDFEGKLHDLDAKEAGEDDDDDDKDQDQEEQLEKQMDDVDEPYADKMDEKMWGDEENEDGEEESQDKEKKEEFGDGAEEESESQLVAKDDNQGEKGDDKKQKEQEKETEQGEEKDTEEEDGSGEIPEPKNLDPKDDTEFNDDEIDPSRANDPPPEPVPEEFDLPEELDLDGMKGDGEEQEEGEEGAEENEENPLEIQAQLPPDLAEEGEGDNEQKEEEGEDGNKDEDKKEDGEEPMETGQEEDGEEEPAAMDMDDGEEDGKPTGDKGVEPQDEGAEEPEAEEDASAEMKPDKAHNPEELPQPAENYGKSQESTEDKQDVAVDDAGKSEEDKTKEKQSVGTADSKQEEGHDGTTTSDMSQRDKNAEDRQNYKRRPGHSDADRTMGSADERVHKRLRTMDQAEERGQGEEKEEKPEPDETSDMYEHIKDASSHYDAQTMDAASEDQLKEQAVPNIPEEGQEGEDLEDGEEVKPLDEMESQEEQEKITNLAASKLSTDHHNAEGEGETGETDVKEDGEEKMEEEKEDKKDQSKEERSNVSTIHTVSELISHDASMADLRPVDPQEMEALRLELEKQLGMLNQMQGTPEEERDSQAMWHRYESLTSGLARDLCEQLRLVLEPTKASKLRGDFHTGKRINMRKVIPYIASGFRKDKIWLRRSKPSKRQYQILLAVDDSSSMNDNHSKQLAFESLAVISNALTWLEAGELGVCSFGESVQLLHPFHEQFTDQSGAKILRQFTFSQRKTKIAQLLKYTTATMLSARSRLQGSNLETSQLLLVVSDGRGLFLEGMETVKAAVRAARDANVFLVFVVIDNPESRDSILDIKVPIFHGAGMMPDIQSYMEHFPFPFYIILRDINSLPETLCDALRQWFELVTAGDIS